jgi:hypothetical protein
MGRIFVPLALLWCCSADCSVDQEVASCSPQPQDDEYRDETSLLQMPLKSLQQKKPKNVKKRLRPPTHKQIVGYVKKVHETKASEENACTYDTISYQLGNYYHHFFPNATDPHNTSSNRTWSRDIQLCVAAAHRLMLRHQLNASEEGANDPEIYATMDHIVEPLAAFEKVYPPTDTIDSCASLCGLHFVDLENMVRAKFHEADVNLEKFKPSKVIKFKKTVKDIYKAYGDLYGTITDPFQAAAVCASAHVYLINDQIGDDDHHHGK